MFIMCANDKLSRLAYVTVEGGTLIHGLTPWCQVLNFFNPMYTSSKL
jgi:hypothetical protein